MAVNPTHSRLKTTAERLIELHGRAVILKRNNKASENSDQPWRRDIEGTHTEIEVQAVFTLIKDTKAGSREEDTKFASILFSDDTYDYREFHKVLDGDDEWTITETSKIKPGEVEIIYKMMLAK